MNHETAALNVLTSPRRGAIHLDPGAVLDEHRVRGRDLLRSGAPRSPSDRSELDSGTCEGVGPPGACPFDFSGRGLRNRARGYLSAVNRSGGKNMATWLWVLIIVLLVLLVFGGIGYGRRGTRV
jgi:hypothetical protein